MRKLLIVSPRFPPINSTDAQRVRMLLPELARLGWKAIVLSVDDPNASASIDDEQLQATGKDYDLHYAKALPRRLTRWVGIGSLALRSKRALMRLAATVVAREKPDLALFSHTEFGLWQLGPYLKQRFGLRYVLDWQDMWITDHYRENPQLTPPGGRLKYAIQEFFSRRLEPAIYQQAIAHIAVSESYQPLMHQRYPQLSQAPWLHLPFPARAADFPLAEQASLKSPLTALPAPEFWLCPGACGPLFETSLRVFFDALRQHIATQPASWQRRKLWFLGTAYYADQQLPFVTQLAQQMGLANYVIETPQRVAHFEMLRLMRQARALVLLGTDDASYNPSRVMPLLFAGRPLLGLLHRQCASLTWHQHAPDVQLQGFVPQQDPHAEVTSLMQMMLLTETQFDPQQMPRRIAGFDASDSAERFISFVERALAEQSQ
jgi:hypothetical protein